MDQVKSGVFAIVMACTIWGLSPLYYKLLSDVPPLELLAHRTLWSAVLFTGVLALGGRLGDLRRGFGDPKVLRVLAIAAGFVSINWFVFIFAIQIGRATEASLGYYIFPLVAVAIGIVVFKEPAGRTRLVAFALAALGVGVLAVGLGAMPWISLVLAFSFGIYGALKKTVDMPPVASVTIEVLVLAPPALAFLAWLHAGPAGGHFGQDIRHSALLIASGPITAVPLMLFAHATRRVSLATVGLVQYLNPTLQFLCAIAIFREPFGSVHMLAFALIWTALAIYSAHAWRQEKARRRASIVAATLGHTVTKSRSEASAKP